MKAMSTTSKRRSLLGRLTLVGIAMLLMLSTPIAFVQRVLADQWDSQIASLQAQANQYQSQANQYRAQADTLQNKLNQINAQISALQTQIAINQTKHEQLLASIAANQAKLVATQDVLGDILANLYVDSDVSGLEMLASSQNISDFVDKQEYRTTIRDQLSSSIAEVNKVKAQLASDKTAVEKVLAQLTDQNNQLGAEQSNQQDLVNQTEGQEAAYQQLVSSAKSKIDSASAQQRAYYASLSNGGASGVIGSFQYWGWSGNQGCSGHGYAYCGDYQDEYADPWGLYNRECVSYLAWALTARFHKSVGNFGGAGNAYQWPSSSGATRVYSPQPGDAVILPASSNFAPVGHAMIVESVSGDNVFVSQYNFYGSGEYSTMWIKTSGVIFLRFPDA